MKRFLVSLVAFAALSLICGCGGGGTGGGGGNQNSEIRLSYIEGFSTGTLTFRGNTWKATSTANSISVTTPTENGDSVAIVTPNPTVVPATYDRSNADVTVVIDGTTFTPDASFRITVEDASGIFSGTFTGSMSSGGRTIDLTSGTFACQY